MKKECYYVEMGVCTCSQSKNCDKYCIGADNCDNFVSGDDFFSQMMDGKLEQNVDTESAKERQARIKKNLSLGKTKKQQKYERKQEEAKLGDGTGYSLKDDPRFKNLF